MPTDIDEEPGSSSLAVLHGWRVMSSGLITQRVDLDCTLDARAAKIVGLVA